MTDDGYSPERLADRARIQDLMHRWCRAVDRLDFDLMRSLFHPEAIDSHGPAIFEGGVEELVAWISGRHAGIPFSLHSLSNMLIEFTGPDQAVVETNVMTVQQLPPEGDPAITGTDESAVARGHMMAFARYADRVERRAGDWRILRRNVILDSQLVLRAAPTEWVPGLLVGRRDSHDFSYALRTAAAH